MNMRKWLSILLALVLLLSLTACGGESKSEAAYDQAAPEAPMEMENGALTDSAAAGSTTGLPANRKLIRTVRMEAETEDLNVLLTALEEKLAALDGYVEAREVYNGSTYASRRYRHAELTLRIPADSLNSFVEHVEENANVVTSSETIDDVTTRYVDTESRIAALEIEQERLLELLSKAETMEDILTIEARLTDVRYELENVASQLRVLDNQVTYATVRLYITEVQEYTPVVEKEPTAWERITEGFGESIEDITDDVKEFCIWILVNSPYLVIWAAVITAVLLVVRGMTRKRKVKSAPKPDSTDAPKE